MIIRKPLGKLAKAIISIDGNQVCVGTSKKWYGRVFEALQLLFAAKYKVILTNI